MSFWQPNWLLITLRFYGQVLCTHTPLATLPSWSPCQFTAQVRGVTTGCMYSGTTIIMPHGTGRPLIGTSELPVDWVPPPAVQANEDLQLLPTTAFPNAPFAFSSL